MTELQLLHHPDPSVRLAKARWSQTRSLLRDALRASVADAPVGVPSVRFLVDDPSLARSVAAGVAQTYDCGLPSLDEGLAHVLVAVLPSAHTADERAELFSAVFRALRPSGRAVLVADVVPPLDGSAPQTPSMGELYADLSRAWGGSLHIDVLRSHRWAGDPLVRAVSMTVTSLRVNGARP